MSSLLKNRKPIIFIIACLVILAASCCASRLVLKSLPYYPVDLKYWDTAATTTLDTREQVLGRHLDGSLKLIRFSSLNSKYATGLSLSKIYASFTLEKESYFEFAGYDRRGISYKLRFVSQNSSGDKSGLFLVEPGGSLKMIKAFPVELNPAETHKFYLEIVSNKAVVTLDEKKSFTLDEIDSLGYAAFSSGRAALTLNNIQLLGRLDGKDFFIYEDFKNPLRNSANYFLVALAFLLLLLTLAAFYRLVCKITLYEAFVGVSVAAVAVIVFAFSSMLAATIAFALFNAALLIFWRKKFIFSISHEREYKHYIAPAIIALTAFITLLMVFSGPVRESSSTEKITLSNAPVSFPFAKKLTFAEHIHFKNAQFRNTDVSFKFKLGDQSGFDVFFRRQKKLVTMFRFKFFINRELINWYSIRVAGRRTAGAGFL